MDPQTSVDRFLTHLKANGKTSLTVKAYRWGLQRFVGYCQKRNLVEVRDISSDDVTSFVEHFENHGHAPSTGNRMKAALNGLFSYLHAAGHVFHIPVALGYSRVVRPVPPVLVEKQRQQLDDVMAFRADLYLLLQLYLGKGLRLSEALDLDINDVEAKELVRVVGKGRKVRELDITPELRRAITRWLEEREAIMAQANPKSKRYNRRALFVNQWGWRLSPRRAQQLMRNRFDSIGLKRVTIHTLRHAFANELRGLKVDLRTIQEILGHANISTTQIYTHVSREDVSRALQGAARARAPDSR